MGITSAYPRRATASTHTRGPVPDDTPGPVDRRPAQVFVRTATTVDLPDMAELHVAHLPVGFFPLLGPGFVARWQAAFLDSPHAIALVAVERGAGDGETVVGFLVGTSDRRAFRRELLHRHRRSLLRHGAAALLGRPRLLAGFLRGRASSYAARAWGRHHPGTATDRPTGHDAPSGELTAIAVDPAARGAGIGRRLADIYLGRCTSVGVAWVELATAAGSDSAIRFYERTGWTPLHRSQTRDGVPVAHFGRRPAADHA